MKKLISAVCFILSAIIFSGCAAAAPVLTLDSEKPWGNYEKSVYTVEIAERIESGGQTVNGRTFADGELKFELTQYRGDGFDLVKLITDFSVTYRDEEYAAHNRGLTDIIHSEVIFLKDGCAPVYSEKTAEFAPRKNSEGVYADTHSYTYTADYNAKTAVIHKGRSIDGVSGAVKTAGDDDTVQAKYKETVSFNLNTSSQVFDNEQLFYIVRAFSGLKPENTVNFSVSNIYDIAVNIDGKGKYDVTPFAVSAGAELSPVAVNTAMFDDYETVIENGAVSCMKTAVSLAVKLPGPAVTVYYTNPENQFVHKATTGKTSKLLVKMIIAEFDLTSGKEAFNTVYTLSEYSTVA